MTTGLCLAVIILVVMVAAVAMVSTAVVVKVLLVISKNVTDDHNLDFVYRVHHSF